MDNPFSSVIDLLIGIAFVGVLMTGAASDLRRLEIPDWLSIVLAVAFLPWAAFVGVPVVDIAVQYGLAFGLFVIGAILFSAGFIGGGDVKFVAAVALWFHWHEFGFLFIWIALFGGLLAALVLLLVKLRWLRFLSRHLVWLDPENGYRQPVPYGVAIAGAGLLTVLRNDFSLFKSFADLVIS